jgi:predicted DNA-binding transcriptional regulator AlpA
LTPTLKPTPGESLWSEREIAAYLHLQLRYVRDRLRHQPDFPEPVRIGSMRRWQPREIRRWAGE